MFLSGLFESPTFGSPLTHGSLAITPEEEQEGGVRKGRADEPNGEWAVTQ